MERIERATCGEIRAGSFYLTAPAAASETRIMPGLIRGFDQLSEALMRVDFERPDGEIASGLIDNTPENLARVSADLKGC